MKIISTPQVKSFAQKAIDVQNAINPLAVTNFLIEVQRHFREPNNGQEVIGPEISIQNPISVMVLDKLLSLARMEQSSVIKADIACEQLINGQDCEWEIIKY